MEDIENAANAADAESTPNVEGATTDRRKWLTALGALPVLAGVGAVFAREQSHREGSFQRPQPARAMLQQRNLPDVALATHDGKTVRFYQDLVKDKKVVLTFINTKYVPESTKVVENLAKLQNFFGKRIGNDIFMYTITSNPQRDTPEVLNAWAAQYGAGPGWKFLTGRPADIERLRGGLGFISEFADQRANPRYPIGILRYGSEPEMRWGHCQSLAAPRVLAHSIQLDFGTDPNDPNPPAIWNCRRLVAGL